MKKVLIVEDDNSNRYLLKLVFEKAGYTVTEVINGEGAVELALEEVFDLILVDLKLPDIDGFEAVKRIRKQGKNKDSKIVATTAFAARYDSKRAKKVGCDGFIEKLIDPINFVSKVESLVS